MTRRVVLVCCLLAALLAACTAPQISPGEEPSPSAVRRIPEGPLEFSDTLAYVSDAPGNYEVFVLSPDSEPVRLTESEGDEGYPIWSPDGTTIAFGRREADGTVDVWTMDANGGSQQRIYDSDSVFLEGMAWRPNGKTLYLARGYFDGPGNMGLKVVVISAEGPEAQSGLGVERLWDRHFTYAYPAVTLDGGMIAFAHYEGYAIPSRLDIYTGVMEPDGKSVHRIVQLNDEDGIDRNPAWSPDGTAIAWERETAKDSGQFNVWVIDADGNGGTRVTSEPGRQVDPVWSSDGLALIYPSDESGSFQLYMRYAWGDGEALQLTDGDSNNLNPDVKPSH